MSTEITLINQALSRLGRRQITQFESPVTLEEKLIALWRVDTRKQVLEESGGFNFASQRVRLPKSNVSAAFGDHSVYHLPSNYISLLSVGEGGRVLTEGFRTEVVDDKMSLIMPRFSDFQSGESLPIRYVFDQSNFTLWTSLASKAYKAALIVNLAYDLNADKAMIEKSEAEYELALRRAKAKDAAESPLKRVMRSDLILFRGRYRRDSRYYNDVD